MSQQVVQEYIRRINTADVEGLLELLTFDHVLCVDGEPLSRALRALSSWHNCDPLRAPSDRCQLSKPLG